jgi:hypothetical protein
LWVIRGEVIERLLAGSNRNRLQLGDSIRFQAASVGKTTGRASHCRR